jgi:hypothetical protein
VIAAAARPAGLRDRPGRTVRTGPGAQFRLFYLVEIRHQQLL